MTTKEIVCPVCGGTGKRFAYRNEVDRHYVGPCQPCYGTGRIEGVLLSFKDGQGGAA